MFKMLKVCVLLSAAGTLMIAGCTKKPQTVGLKTPDVSLSCVGVMPVVAEAARDKTAVTGDMKNIRHGIEVLENLLHERYMGRDDIRFIGAARMYDIDNSGATSFMERAKKVGAQVSCNGVLEVTLNRYRDRIGGRYSAQEPASVAFSYRLVEVNTGVTVCRGSYDEVQKSVMENLYNFDDARKRGFTWVTAGELLREGLDKKFGECPPLQEKE